MSSAASFSLPPRADSLKRDRISHTSLVEFSNLRRYYSEQMNGTQHSPHDDKATTTTTADDDDSSGESATKKHRSDAEADNGTIDATELSAETVAVVAPSAADETTEGGAEELKSAITAPCAPATASSSASPFYSNALSALINELLPPVLTQLVMQYYSAILPTRHHYTGHAFLENNAYFRYANDYRLSSARSATGQPLLSRPLRLDHRSFSWSGWVNRTSTVDNQFLFSFSNPHVHVPPLLSNLHVGYRHYQLKDRHVECFTFGFWCNDLDAKQPADVTSTDEWEHWCGTFEYPVSSPLPSTDFLPSLFSILPSYSLPAVSAPSLGHRRLYRNGRLLVSDECPAFTGTNCVFAVGNRLVSSQAKEGLKGGVGDLRLWSRALREDEVVALWEGEEEKVSKEALEVWYRFDESEEGINVEGDDEVEDEKREMEKEKGRLLLDHSGHERHAALIIPNEIRMLRHSGTVEYPKLPSWEGTPH